MKITNKDRNGIVIPMLSPAEPVLLSGRATALGLDNMVFYVVDGRQYVRTYRKPRNPRIKKQQLQRKRFGELARIWRTLTTEKKEEYNRRAEDMNQSGFNLFVSENAKCAQQ